MTGIPRPPRDVSAWMCAHTRGLVLALAVLVTGLVLVSMTAAALDDAAIDSATRRSSAEVISVSSGGAIVRFTTPSGAIRTPVQGVAYPSGLEQGQRVRVAYAAGDPELVRVAGRSATTGLVPAGLVIAATWLVALLAIWGSQRRHRPRRRR